MVLERLLNRFLFVGCEPTYEESDFDGQLLWLPVRRDDGRGGPESEIEYSFPCLMLPCPDATHLVLFFHRNAEDLGCCRQFCESLREKVNVHVLAIEYPGYGLFHRGAAQEAPEPGAAQAIRHAEVALAFLQREMAMPLSRILLFGCSVGTGLAMKLAAAHEDLGGLVLVAPFLSVRAVATDRVGSALAWALLPKDDFFPNEVRAASVRCPTVIVHGLADTVIPVSHSQRLYERLTCRKLLLTPEGLGHNSCLLAHRGLLVAPMARFFDLPDLTIEGPMWHPKKPPIGASRGCWPPAWAQNPTPVTPATDDSCLDDWPPSPMTPKTGDDSWSDWTPSPWSKPEEAIPPEPLQQSWPSRSSELANASSVAREPQQRPLPRNPLQVLLATGKPTELAGDPDDAPLRLLTSSLARSPRGPRCCQQPGKVMPDVGSVDRFFEYTVEL